MMIYRKAKKHTLNTIKDKKYKEHDVIKHKIEVEKWAKRFLKKYANADKDIVLSSVWLHDIGLMVGEDKDHAVNSEKEAIRFLKKLKVDRRFVDEVAHCIRAHRNKDVAPKSLEAKILAVCDSLNHMADYVYIILCMQNKKDEAISKLKRDYRDIGLLPGVRDEFKPLYKTWIKLLEEFPEVV